MTPRYPRAVRARRALIPGEGSHTLPADVLILEELPRRTTHPVDTTTPFQLVKTLDS